MRSAHDSLISDMFGMWFKGCLSKFTNGVMRAVWKYNEGREEYGENGRCKILGLSCYPEAAEKVKEIVYGYLKENSEDVACLMGRSFPMYFGFSYTVPFSEGLIVDCLIKSLEEGSDRKLLKAVAEMCVFYSYIGMWNDMYGGRPALYDNLRDGFITLGVYIRKEDCTLLLGKGDDMLQWNDVVEMRNRYLMVRNFLIRL